MLSCAECGTPHAKWAGQCSGCGAWNSIAEDKPVADRGASPSVPVRRLGDVDPADAAPRPTGIGELDRVLGGGLVPGSVTVVGGEPGIGKSTLAMQVAGWWAGPVLYISGEESPQQVRQRAARLLDGSGLEEVWIAAETSLRGVVAAIDDVRPSLVVVDSIQTVADERVGSTPGSPNQVRECTQQLVGEAKRRGLATMLVGHVTKEGALAGPRALEHIVDTVLSFEGERHHALRMLRAVKHRFGNTNELGLFEMTGDGLAGVPDPSRLFLSDRADAAAGSAIVAAMEGRRPLLVEVQALTIATVGKVPARRTAQGLDHHRLAMLLAVIERRLRVSASAHDVYASSVGGVRLTEPAADLGVALAVLSTIHDLPLPADLVTIGEIGLAGEVRHVAHAARRLTEAARLGSTRALVPPGTPPVDGIETVPVATLAAASRVALGECLGSSGSVRPA